MLNHWDQRPECYKKDTEEQYVRLLKGPGEFSESKNWLGGGKIEMLIVSNRVVGQRMERKKDFVDFIMLYDISLEWTWQEPTFHLLVDLHMISSA